MSSSSAAARAASEVVVVVGTDAADDAVPGWRHNSSMDFGVKAEICGVTRSALGTAARLLEDAAKLFGRGGFAIQEESRRIAVSMLGHTDWMKASTASSPKLS